MSNKHAYLVKWVAGIASSVVAGVVLFLIRQTGGLLNRGPTPEKDTRTVWKEGALGIPVSAGGLGRVADLDGGRLLQL